MSDENKALSLIFSQMSAENNAQQDALRMAVGFLDTDKLTEVAPYKSFVALVSLTKGEIKSKRKFAIPVKRLMEELGIEHNNYARLEQTIDYLMTTLVNFNVHKKDRHAAWHKAQILGPSRLENGIIEFEFTEPVWEKLQNPIVYAYITRKGAYSFTSKHEVALYNWLTCMLVPSYSEAYCIESIDYLLKDVLYLNPNDALTYTRFKYLNQKILSKAIQKINEKTNLYVEYEGVKVVDAAYYSDLTKNGKKVITHIKQAEKQRKIAFVRFYVRQGATQAILAPEPKPLSKTIRRHLETMVKEGLVFDSKIEQFLLNIIDEQGESACIQRLENVLKEFRQVKNRLNNPGGFLRTMLFQQVALEQETAAETGEQVIDSYVPVLEEALHSVTSHVSMLGFVNKLKQDYSHHIPTLKQLVEQDASLRLSTQQISLENQEELLKKPSVTAVLYKYRSVFGYEDTPIDLKTVLSTENEQIIRNARERLPLDKRQVLMTQAKQAGLRFEQLEAMALDRLVAKIR